jgi:hypothetical protein
MVANLEKLYLHFQLQLISPTAFLSIVLELWITLYIGTITSFPQLFGISFDCKLYNRPNYIGYIEIIKFEGKTR